jgi:sugar O-acyltransferase (sialic acid O-acetyltransferase NeuD family)
MRIKKLTILGKNDIKITMILDNLESNNDYPVIEIINNLGLPIEHTFTNPKFIILLRPEIESYQDCFLGVNNPIFKKKVVDVFNVDISKFINVINKNSSISSTSKIGRGCLINSMVSIAAHSTIGNFVTINRNSSIGHHTNIGDLITINPGVNIAGNCVVGEGSTLGMGVNVIDGINIGKNSIIGAGSLVTKNIPDNVIAYGSPCKIIKENV